MQPSDPTLATPLPAPDPMEGHHADCAARTPDNERDGIQLCDCADPMEQVVGRVTEYVEATKQYHDTDDVDMTTGGLLFGDFRALLAAYQSVREEIAHQKQVAEDAEVRAMVATARLAARGREEGT